MKKKKRRIKKRNFILEGGKLEKKKRMKIDP